MGENQICMQYVCILHSALGHTLLAKASQLLVPPVDEKLTIWSCVFAPRLPSIWLCQREHNAEAGAFGPAHVAERCDAQGTLMTTPPFFLSSLLFSPLILTHSSFSPFSSLFSSPFISAHLFLSQPQLLHLLLELLGSPLLLLSALLLRLSHPLQGLAAGLLVLILKAPLLLLGLLLVLGVGSEKQQKVLRVWHLGTNSHFGKAQGHWLCETKQITALKSINELAPNVA